jgi:hypothetical protein
MHNPIPRSSPPGIVKFAVFGEIIKVARQSQHKEIPKGKSQIYLEDPWSLVLSDTSSTMICIG